MHLLLVLWHFCSALFLVVPMNGNGLIDPAGLGLFAKDCCWKLKISCQDSGVCLGRREGGREGEREGGSNCTDA